MKKILLVEDEKETALVFETALKGAGYEVVVANNGNTGINTAISGGFDGILLDQMLPDIPGNEILRTLKSNETTKATPIAMLTNFGNDEMIKDALNAGAADYLLKYSVSPEDLIVKVRGMVGE